MREIQIRISDLTREVPDSTNTKLRGRRAYLSHIGDIADRPRFAFPDRSHRQYKVAVRLFHAPTLP